MIMVAILYDVYSILMSVQLIYFYNTAGLILILILILLILFFDFYINVYTFKVYYHVIYCFVLFCF